MLSKEKSKNLLKGVDYAKGDSKSVTNFLEVECPKCNHKIEYRLAIGDIKNVEEYIEQLETKEQKLIEKLEADIEKANKIINDKEYRYIDEVVNEEWTKRKYAQEILNLLKGEKE